LAKLQDVKDCEIAGGGIHREMQWTLRHKKQLTSLKGKQGREGKTERQQRGNVTKLVETWTADLGIVALDSISLDHDL
jgi:hypothetical protein